MFIPGSSPLARGLLKAPVHITGATGIIPARAGFTPRGFDSPVRHGGSSPLARGLRLPGRGHLGQGGIIPARAGFTYDSPATSVLPRDHPRSRGVYRQIETMGISHQGSSPLARGLLARVADELGTPGIIPARAGFTRFWSSSPTGTRDHPRSRGVYQTIFFGTKFHYGSSPLARGLRRRSCR